MSRRLGDSRDVVVEVRCAGKGRGCARSIVSLTAGWATVGGEPVAVSFDGLAAVRPASGWLVLEGAVCPDHATVRGVDGVVRSWMGSLVPVRWSRLDDAFTEGSRERRRITVWWLPGWDLDRVERVRRRSRAAGWYQVKLIGGEGWIDIAAYTPDGEAHR